MKMRLSCFRFIKNIDAIEKRVNMMNMEFTFFII